MTLYFAFLRAINVGGHTLKMDALRGLFEDMGFSSVETFIASGNVIFEAQQGEPRALEQQIERHLRAALGYEVAAFLRTGAELRQAADVVPFAQERLDAAQALNVAFLTEALDEAAQQKLLTLRTEIDDFAVHGREMYWLCLKKQSESTFSNVVFEKAVGRKSTLRGISTVRKMADKYCPAPS